MDDTINAINSIVEFHEIHKYMNDDQVDRALALVAKIIANPKEISPQRISETIIELQALSTKFALCATYYSGIGKEGRSTNDKKNLYYTLRASVDELVNALKYHQKAGMY